METAIFYITLDIDDAYSHVSMNLHQGESGRKISASFSQSSKPYPISEGCHAVFAGTVPDGQVFFNDCVIENECVICELPAQITSLFGLVKAEIRLYGDKGRLIASPAFTINVVESAMEDGTLLERIETTALTELIGQAKEAVAECKSSVIDEVELSYQENGGEASAHAQLEENEDGRTLQFHFSNLKGEVGEQGPKGDKGDKGDRGETGDIGPAGKDGADCTPLALGAYVTPTAAGDIASFDDGAEDVPVKSLVVNIEPVQDLNGYNAPWPPGGGANLFDGQARRGYYGADGVYYATPNSNENYANVNPIPVVGGNEYYLVGEISTGQNTVAWYDANMTLIAINTNAPSNIAITAPENAAFLNFKLRVADFESVKAAVNYPATVTAYAPYSNICPISGWTGAKVTRTEKNLFDIAEAYVGPNQTVSGTTISKVETAYNFDMLNGTTGAASLAAKTIALKAGTYTLSGVVTGEGTLRVYVVDEQGFVGENPQHIAAISSTNDPRTFTLDVDSSITLRYSNRNANTITNLQLELGSTATAYEPYQSDTYDISFPTEAGTVYGGRLDVTTGLLTVDRAKLTLNTADMRGSDIYPGWWSDELSNIIKTPINNVIQTQLNIGTSVGVNTIITEGANIFLPSNVYGKNRSEWQALALDVQILLPYTTPVTYQLTPTEVNTLLGVNNIHADTGGVEVSYRADPTKIYEKVMNAMLTMTSGLYMTDECGTLDNSDYSPYTLNVEGLGPTSEEQDNG